MTDLKNTLFLTLLQKLKLLNPHLKCCFGDYYYIKFQYGTQHFVLNVFLMFSLIVHTPTQPAHTARIYTLSY